MALPETGAISLSQINLELELSEKAGISLGSDRVRALAEIASGAISMANLRGKSAFRPMNYRYVGGLTSTSGEPNIYDAPIGAPSTKKRLVVVGYTRCGDYVTAPNPTVTINGVVATRAVSAQTYSNGSSALYYALVPEGDVARVVVTNAGGGLWALGVYVINNPKNINPIYAGQSGSTASQGARAFPLQYETGSVVIGAWGAISTAGITGLTRDLFGQYGFSCAGTSSLLMASGGAGSFSHKNGFGICAACWL